MIFDSDKSQGIHFSRTLTFSNLDIKFPPFLSQKNNIAKQIIKPVEKKASMRWLRLFYDSKLLFKNHANKLVSKERQGASELKMLVEKT